MEKDSRVELTIERIREIVREECNRQLQERYKVILQLIREDAVAYQTRELKEIPTPQSEQ